MRKGYATRCNSFNCLYNMLLIICSGQIMTKNGHLPTSNNLSRTICLRRGEYLGLEEFLLQHFPVVTICKLMHYNCININIAG